MIVYQATKSRFLEDAQGRDIEEIVADVFMEKVGRRVGQAEVRSWRESLACMAKVLRDEGIPADTGVAIEYNIPQSGKRVDFILTGRGPDNSSNVIIVELKQWSRAELTGKDGLVSTRFSGRMQETSHPSYQAWSYAALLEGFNEAVYDEGLKLQPCAYLHNYVADEVITNDFFQPYIERAPVFLKGEVERNKLRDFIKRYVKYGDDVNLIYKIENGRIRPSKMLADSLMRMLKGQPEFVLIDDQKVVYENALAMSRHTSEKSKKVLIVEGGPGTGKSVVAINLLTQLTKDGQVCKYVSKNAAPRTVYKSKLTGSFRQTVISNLFSGSGSFFETEPNTFDTLIVDEAHRLNEKSGLYENRGENQIKELIDSAKFSVFFVDGDQRVTLKDIGSPEEIERWAIALGGEVLTLKLESQFRCNGSDGYLAWIDNMLRVRDTANTHLDVAEFDFRVMDSPAKLHSLIEEKNEINNKARVVAGYCWEWASKNNASAQDVVIPEHGYAKRWNLTSDGSLWIVAPKSVHEVGCIHTCQGLEVDYIGVIVGDDFVVRNGEVQCHPEKRAKSDRSIRGYKQLLKESPVAARHQLDLIIKNTYRTLMTRGTKGCYVYCTDSETADYFRAHLAVNIQQEVVPTPARVAIGSSESADANVLPFRRLPKKQVRPYINSVPVVDLKFAAGSFSDPQTFDPVDAEWVELPGHFRPQAGLFVAQVIGESMNRRIPNGSWCLFRANPAGTRVGKVVVAQHRSINDADLGGSYTVKVYTSGKEASDDGVWQHSYIHLKPDSDDAEFAPLIFERNAAEDVCIVAELVAIL